MNKGLLMLWILLVSTVQLCAQELRGTWISRNEIGSKAQIAYVMDSLANNNFNVAYVNCWSRGYPLWQSERFKKETGLSIDPNYVGRDILSEAIAEGHRRGIEVEGWFEYGFVGGYTGYLPGDSGKGKIFDVHPNWVARKVDGTEKDASNFYWMTQTRPEVQQLLLDLCKEVAQKYDIDGIELDRVRYAGNQYGYDSYTDSVYRAQHSGAAPPTNTTDAGWMRWRADLLNDFMRKAYDTIKAVNPRIMVTNAPANYSSSSYQSYNDNLQDWIQWVRTGSVDQVQVQMYVSDNYTWSSYLNYVLSQASPKEKIFPSLAVAPNGVPIATSELLAMVNTSRSTGVKGNSWWYFGDFTPTHWNFFRNQAYPARAEVPGRSAGWRIPAVVVNETDSSAQITGTWLTYNANGFQGKALTADSIGTKSIEYSFAVPFSAWYEVYAYQLTSLTSRVPFDVYDSSGGGIRVYVDQTSAKNNGWMKLADVYLKKGKKTVVKVSNEKIGLNKFLVADAAMIVLNRKLSPDVITTDVQGSNGTIPLPGTFWLGQNFPNPFNPATKIQFSLPGTNAHIHSLLKVYDSVGREVATPLNREMSSGEYTVLFDGSQLSSGIYYYHLQAGEYAAARKMILLK